MELRAKEIALDRLVFADLGRSFSSVAMISYVASSLRGLHILFAFIRIADQSNLTGFLGSGQGQHTTYLHRNIKFGAARCSDLLGGTHIRDKEDCLFLFLLEGLDERAMRPLLSRASRSSGCHRHIGRVAHHRTQAGSFEDRMEIPCIWLLMALRI